MAEKNEMQFLKEKKLSTKFPYQFEYFGLEKRITFNAR